MKMGDKRFRNRIGQMLSGWAGRANAPMVVNRREDDGVSCVTAIPQVRCTLYLVLDTL